MRSAGSQWILDVRDNASTGQDGDFSFLYLPPATSGVYAGRLSSGGSLISATAVTQALGVTATPGPEGLDLRFGDGSLVHPGSAALFLSADSTHGGATSAAADNLISWSANGSSYRIFSQDLPGISGRHQAIDLRFLIIPHAPVESLPSVSLHASDATAGEWGGDSELRFALRRTGSLAGQLVVPLSAGGSATPGVDYTGLPANITLPAGQAEVSFTLTVLADDLAEGSEIVLLRLLGGAGYAVVAPNIAQACLVDHPAQDWLAGAFADLPNRHPADDADGDGLANLAEYFMGTSPLDGSEFALPSADHREGQVMVRYPRALNREAVQGILEWSTDLRQWRRSGQRLGALQLEMHESTVSAPGQDPLLIEASVSIPEQELPARLFFRLRFE